ncbi:MAG: hypothetical protein NTY47_02975 [Candidatus Omnitrophica bacterium]|nr:hypothetical protein [Candidatus Omnitrophota bacterium]
MTRLNTNKTESRLQITVNRGRKLFWPLFAVFCLLLSSFCLLGMAQRPHPKVYIKKLPQSRYQLMVDKKPFVIKGVCYSPIPVGESNSYDWWSDLNKPWLVDGKLMQEMGVNTVRLYESHENIEEVKTFIRDMYEKFGIRTVIGNWLGFWQYPCPFYGDKAFEGKIKQEILQMVKDLKDEPGVLMWVLGNENNYSCLGQVNAWSTSEIDKETDPQKQKEMRAEVYYSFVNDISKSIHAIDPDHPVALGNGELIGLDQANKYCQDVDLVACIIYRGKTFGNLFNSLKATFDKPLFISEFGADAYDAYLDKEDQNMQAFFLESQWRQIYQNLATNKEGAGNCIGGTMFEWNDEWWKHDESNPSGWKEHDIASNWSNGSYYFDIKAKDNKNMNEEWFGLVALSQESENGVNKRIPRKAYYVIRDFWKNPDLSNGKGKNKK